MLIVYLKFYLNKESIDNSDLNTNKKTKKKAIIRVKNSLKYLLPSDYKVEIIHPDTPFASLSIKMLTLFLTFFSFLPTHLNSSVSPELPWIR